MTARGPGDTGPAQPASAAHALVALVARALDLERVALLAADESRTRFVPVASHGAVRLRAVTRAETPGDGPWSAVVPLTEGGATGGLLLLARPGGTPLSPEDLALVHGLAGGMAAMLVHDALRGDLARAHHLLARADQLSAVGMLAASVAHEIRNPLVSVRTFIQLLPQRLDDEEFRTGFRLLALDEIERICTLISDLLAFSRPEQSEREPTDMAELVGQVVRLLDVEARHTGVALVYDQPTEVPRVLVHDGQLKQVLLNVVLNAIQACASRDTVEIAVGTETIAGTRWCLITVADTGPGIPPEHRRLVFDPFFTTKDGGSGLGLFLAHQIVSEHGGILAATGRDPRGSLFSIRLPVAVFDEEVALDAR